MSQQLNQVKSNRLNQRIMKSGVYRRNNQGPMMPLPARLQNMMSQYTSNIAVKPCDASYHLAMRTQVPNLGSLRGPTLSSVEATDRQNPLTVTENIVEAEEELQSHASSKEYELLNPPLRNTRPLSSTQNNLSMTEKPTRIVRGRPMTAKVSQTRGKMNKYGGVERKSTHTKIQNSS